MEKYETFFLQIIDSEIFPTHLHRVAYERGETVGEGSVGYKIRLESKDPQGTSGKILYCTTGIILRFLQSDP